MPKKKKLSLDDVVNIARCEGTAFIQEWLAACAHNGIDPIGPSGLSVLHRVVINVQLTAAMNVVRAAETGYDFSVLKTVKQKDVDDIIKAKGGVAINALAAQEKGRN